jgi:hypothetical protein
VLATTTDNADQAEVRVMNQRAVTVIANYLSKRPLGRIARLRPVGDDDYILAINDIRDGRTQLIHSAGDLKL